MKIVEVESFKVEVPLTAEQRTRNCYNSTGITRIRTDEGVTGYGFSAVEEEPVRQILLLEDPFAVERHLEAGLDRWYGAENALWDIVAKAAGLPLHRLWGAYRDRFPMYLTCVWPGAPDQTDVTPLQQAEDVSRYAELGYRAVKIRSWRPDPMEDVEAVRLIREWVGGRDRIEVMIDRTGEYSGTTWDYETALDVARALEEVDATWLEEPFARGDVELHARLRSETRIAITGGEHQPPEVYPGYIKGGAFDIVQPHCANVFLTLKRVAGMAEMCGMACILHGSHGMNLVGSLQVSATIRTCRMQELVYTTPPALPEEAWAPLNVLTRSGRLYEVEDGCVRIPDSPGLGIDLDEDAIERYRAVDS
ncbi:MAG: mandelate racemase/muconate lactonizing enzyme family protein [Candidatus Latescibacteria bacterium]|jgi:D-galactarolactone cycloisomerase|nr:mandelate racemase/muconate lactonizing enzyme family protein [Candidatus Latescibacterota bacterium]